MTKAGNSSSTKTAQWPRTAAYALTFLATTGWTPLASANEFAAIIQLSSLNGANGFRLDGVKSGDNTGNSVASAADVNGDGISDVVVGAWLADPNADRSGSSYVVFGKGPGSGGFPANIDLSALNGSNGFRLDGAAFLDVVGYSVASAGDINGDGFADVIVGTFLHDLSYVVFGRASGFPPAISLSTLNGTNGFRLDGADDSGSSVAGAGDVNGDGFADLIIGARGADPHGINSGSSYVLFGKPSGFASAINLSTLNGNNGFRLDGVTEFDLSGISVAGAGDVNGDGFADVITGAIFASPHGPYSGSSYVVFGKASGFAAAINLSTLNGSNGFRLDGSKADDQIGRPVASAGDINGDGFADVIVGARLADPPGGGSGSSYVVFGKATGFAATTDLSTLDGSNGFRLDGAAGDQSGNSAASAGDVNGDGFADLIVGGWLNGLTYVIFGKSSGFAATTKLSTLNGSNGFRLDGSGYSVAGAGDVNGDGFADVIVGAPNEDPHGYNSGSSYVVFGRAPDTARTRVGAAANQYISGGAFGDTLKGLGGNDILEGRGSADTLIGGTRNDTATYLHAPSDVIANLASPGGNTGHAAGDTYTAIENLAGSRFADTLTGNSGANTLTGGKSADTLRGADGNDRLIGGPGKDAMNGGPGADIFVFDKRTESRVGTARDTIAGFNAGSAGTSVDRIDLRKIDARTGVAGNQAFRFIGTNAFSNVKGQLRISLSGSTTIVSGDVNGDRVADFQIGLLNFTALSNITAIDFLR